MCKTHDQQHYSPIIRQAATCAAMGNGEKRDLLMQVWTYHGLLDWMDRYGEEMSSARQDVCMACIRKEKHGLQRSYDAAIQDLVNAWQDELAPDMDVVPC